jgi:sulfite exporter TauE/SafE
VTIEPALLLAAWLAGLAGGGGHCLGMCGGVIGMLGVGQKPGITGYLTQLAAHAGRIAGYASAGAVIGFLGATGANALLGTPGLTALRAVAAALVVAIGLQLILGRPLLQGLERQGAKLWRHLAPLLRGLLPPRTPLRAFAVGALWGYLPCGLVYAQLTVAATAGGALMGALVMAAFGLGTVVSLSIVSTLLQSIGLGRLPRQASGAVLLAFGIWIALPLLVPSHADHSAEAAADIVLHVHHGADEAP